jgi:hypothetical protein
VSSVTVGFGASVGLGARGLAGDLALADPAQRAVLMRTLARSTGNGAVGRLLRQGPHRATQGLRLAARAKRSRSS